MSTEKVKQLIAERDAIDAQIAALTEVLTSNDVTMDTSLVDTEGFPKPELDIISIRRARNSIACLTNDRKRLTDEIESELVEVHQSNQEVAALNAMDTNDNQVSTSAVRRTTNRPYLKVEHVAYGSPAHNAGLKNDDYIVQCGPVHGDNFEGLQKFAAVINAHVGNKLKITVLRDTTVHRLTASPGKWDGAGVFGARFGVVTNFKF